MATDATAPAVEVSTLLKTFAKLPGCDAYDADGKKVKLLLAYLWQRQLSPALPFETFLQLYAPLADFSDENRKHPDDSLKFHCPVAKSEADKLHVPQWSAKERVGLLSLYVDMVREAARVGVPVPLLLDEFLSTFGAPYKSGELGQATAPPARAAAPPAAAGQPVAATTAAATVPPAGGAPSVPGQRIIYSDPRGRQIRGVTREITHQDDRAYVTFTSDAGEVIEGVSILACVLTSEPVVPSAAPETVKERKKFLIAKNVGQSVRDALGLQTVMGNVALGAVIYPIAIELACGLAVDLNVLNGETGPYVDPQLVDPVKNVVLADLPPRKNIVGEYTFRYGPDCYVVEVAYRE